MPSSACSVSHYINYDKKGQRRSGRERVRGREIKDKGETDRDRDQTTIVEISKAYKVHRQDGQSQNP